MLKTSLAMTAAVFCGTAQAQDCKPEQVTIVLPHGVGGGQDRLTREFGAVWEKHLGVPVVYENVSGASGRRGHVNGGAKSGHWAAQNSAPRR